MSEEEPISSLAFGLADRTRIRYAIVVTRAKREKKEKAKANAQSKRASDRARHEREAFAKRLDAAKKAAAQTTPATGIVDDDE